MAINTGAEAMLMEITGLRSSVETTKKLAAPKMMRLVDPSSGEMQCNACGSVHFAARKTGGHYHRGAWQCLNGCTKDDIEARSDR